ncbi:MAG: DUF938 domain-containing protein [Bdellovibrionota bacterium]
MSGLSEAAERNKAPIAEALSGVLPASGTVLEIASGTGQHIAYFAEAFPHLRWIPSEADPFRRLEIETHVVPQFSNCTRPLELDVLQFPADPIGRLRLLRQHDSHFKTADDPALFDGASSVLDENGTLFLYGPFFYRNKENAASNVAFDSWLKSLDGEYGVRTLEDVAEMASSRGFDLWATILMPANNLSLVFRKNAQKVGET